ncbi:hypothetical protein TYRP_009303 [Tyrophagus putrescentiae]|nr:hypothetical protein TYRP_009303 [Tyrophagus putrescentiae]
MTWLMLRPNSFTYGSVLKSALFTRLLISRSRSGAERAVALIIVEVCMSVSFLMQRWPATMLHTSSGRKYFATVHSTVCPFSSCSGKDCSCAGRRVTLQTRYLRRIDPQCALDLLGELDALRVGQRLALLIHIANVQHLAHKIDHWLRLVEGRRADVNVQRHLPLRRSHRLVEAEPDLAPSAQRVVVALGAAEEGPPHRGVGHRGEVAHHHVERLDRVEGNGPALALQRLLQHVQVDLAEVLDGDAEDAVLALARQRHLQLDLLPADGQVVSGVHVLAPVKDRLAVAEDLLVGLDHRLDDLAVDLARALVRRDGHVVVVEEAAGHGNLKVVRPQADGAAVVAGVGPARRDEGRHDRPGGGGGGGGARGAAAAAAAVAAAGAAGAGAAAAVSAAAIAAARSDAAAAAGGDAAADGAGCASASSVSSVTTCGAEERHAERALVVVKSC